MPRINTDPFDLDSDDLSLSDVAIIGSDLAAIEVDLPNTPLRRTNGIELEIDPARLCDQDSKIMLEYEEICRMKEILEADRLISDSLDPDNKYKPQT